MGVVQDGGFSNWPNASDPVSPLVRPPQTPSETQVANYVAATPGTVGVVDLVAAEAAGFTRGPGNGSTFWAEVQNGTVNGVPHYEDPAFDADSSRRGLAKCIQTTYGNVPTGADPTT